MRFPLLYIRLRQLQREFQTIGIYAVLVLPAAFYFMWISYRQFANKHPYYIVIPLTFLCAMLQINRKDKQFIFSHLENPHWQLFTEYTALTLPFFSAAVFTKSWLYFPLEIVALFCLPFLHLEARSKAVLKNMSRVIPAAHFEWIAGVRKNIALITALYILAAAFCWFRILPLFLLWFLTTMILSFYSECESLQILRETGQPAGKFLLLKLYGHCKYIVLFFTPLIVVNTLCNPEFLLINLLFIPVQVALLCFAILLKYSLYAPNKLETGNSVLLTSIAVLVSLPYFLPIPVILAFIYFYKAKKNLNYYLND